MATIPEREEVCLQAVASLVDQVDELWVILNGFPGMPAALRDRVYLERGKNHGDAGKFRRAWDTRLSALLFTCDDDIIYPPDYTRVLEDKLAGREHCTVGVHGARLRRDPLKNYGRDRDVRHIGDACDEERSEHLLGTGTLAFYASAIELREEHFENGFMADIWFAIQAQKQKVPLISIARPKDWLKPAQPAPTHTIWSRMRMDGDSTQVEAMGRIPKWELHT